MLLNKMFGEDGIIYANDTVCFEEKCKEVEQLSQSISRSFLNYFQKRVKENLNKKNAKNQKALPRRTYSGRTTIVSLSTMYLN